MLHWFLTHPKELFWLLPLYLAGVYAALWIAGRLL